MKRTWIAAGAALAVGVTSAGEARAQHWLSDRALTEGRGLRAGNFEFHPGVGLEFGYDSNALYAPSPNEAPALRLRGTAHVAMSTLGPQRSATAAGATTSALPVANFRAQASVSWQQYFGVPGAAIDPTVGRPLSGPGLGLGFRLEVFPGRTWQFQLYDDFARIVQGSPEAGINLFVFNRDMNTGGFSVIYAPNGGILDARLTYENRFTYYESSQYGILTNDANDIVLRARWRFLPKTALLWEAGVTPTFYLNPSTTLSNSTPIRTRIGINGLLTERVRVLLMVGYQGTYFGRGDNENTVVGQAEVQYIFSPLTSFALGFIRDVNPSYLGNFSTRNSIYARVNQSFAGRFYVSAEVNGGYYQYGYVGLTAPGTTPRFSAFRVSGNIFGEYRPADFLGINATVSATANITDTNILTATGMQSLQYTKFEAYIGVRVNW